MGGSSKLMAFVKEQLITATGLNSTNADLFNGKAYSGTQDWTYWPNTTGYYVRNLGRQFYWSWSNGIFAGGNFYLQKLINGTWTNVLSRSYGWNANASGNVTDQGEGWFRVYFEGTANKTFHIYWAPYPCIKGDYLRYTGGYSSSTHIAGGTTLTAAILNSGRVGTVPTL